MSGYVCTVANAKGGVGKTTAALNLGGSFSNAGYETVVIDADLGMSDLADMAGLDVESTIHDVLASETTVSDASTAVADGLTIVPGDGSLGAYADADPTKLRDVVETARRTHDVVLVDTGPGLSYEATEPLELSDGILLTVTPDTIALDGARTTGRMLERINGNVLGGLLTQVYEEPDLKTIASRLDYPVLGVDPADRRERATEPVVEERPGSDRAEAFEELVDRLERVFFDELKPFAVETAYREEWFEKAQETAPPPQDENDDDEYTHEVFHGI